MTLPCPICAAAAPGPRVCGYCGAHQPSAADIAHVAAIGRATLRAALAPSPAEEAAAGDRVWARLCAVVPGLGPTRRGTPWNEVA